MALELTAALVPAVAGAEAEIAVCPPFPLLGEVAGMLAGSVIGLGAQDLNEADAGAFTGEVAGSMLRECGCSWVIVGHSERRALYGETDARVAAKALAALRAGLRPIVCVGEDAAERAAGNERAVVARQLDAVLVALGERATQELVIAYEPVWAIGTGLTATPAQAQEMHAFVRGRLRQAGLAAAAMRLLYGGSVKAANAAELFVQPDIDGGLIGGAALKAQEFAAICLAARGS